MTSCAEKYVFIAEWFDCESSLLKKFYLFSYPYDDTLELYDIKNRRTFLKRTRCMGVTLKDLFIGNTVEIFARQMNIVDYGDDRTKSKMVYTMQKTFGLIKPDAIDKVGSILRIIYNNGFKVSKMKMALVNKDQAMQFYSDHIGQSYTPYLIDHMISGPVIAMELVAEDAIKKLRDLIGPFDPEKAKVEAPNSIRSCFGSSKNHNAIHASDSPKGFEMVKY